jgi:hypothetical protein
MIGACRALGRRVLVMAVYRWQSHPSTTILNRHGKASSYGT